jgi:hypothetical protein
MKSFKRYSKNNVELTYSAFFFVSGNYSWHCRIWIGLDYKESFGRNKFDAYRKALKSEIKY